MKESKREHKLDRMTMATSRMMEFFSVKELNMQIGHSADLWPLALTKELIDNSLDACESAGIQPDIVVAIEDDAISVEHNGPGLPEHVLTSSLDFNIRISDKSHYCSPTRGQLGNALKCVWAAPFVQDGSHGRIEVLTEGNQHAIDVTMNHLKQEPEIHHEVTSCPGHVKSGTIVKMLWPDVASSLHFPSTGLFYSIDDLIRAYATLNPHAKFTLHLPDEEFLFPRTVDDWKKWVASQPTSIHWYNFSSFSNLILGYLRAEQETGKVKTVGKFLQDFDGLKGTAKQSSVTKDAGLTGANLNDLFSGKELDKDFVRTLMQAMKRHAKIVQPNSLGKIDPRHIQDSLIGYWGCAPESIRQKRVRDTIDGLPFVWEIGFGVQEQECERERELIVGVNWSPLLNCPFEALWDWLGDNRVDSHDPVTVVAHFACPRLEFVDRGKTRAKLPEAMAETMKKSVKSVFKQWVEEKRRADRENQLHHKQLEKLRKATKADNVDIKEAAYQVMEESYMHASGNNTSPANARQIMYVARGPVQKLAHKCWARSGYFTQTILPQFIEDHPQLTENWDVVFDSRGRFLEPHTQKQVELGTLAVREYLAAWRTASPDRPDGVTVQKRYPTLGPCHRYRYALFVEKEGFNPHLEHHRIAERYDVAIMSTKGMSVTASRKLVDELSKSGVTILVLRDFDKAGFSIVHTLRSDSFRYKFDSTPNVIDIGLRLEDAQAWGLIDLAEDVRYKNQKKDPKITLRLNGATEEECQFLVDSGPVGGWSGRRVELNALSSPQFIDYIETKFKEVGISKVIPEDATLRSAYKRACGILQVQSAIDSVVANFTPDDYPSVPEGLRESISARLKGTDLPWDQVLMQIAAETRKKNVDPSV